MKWIGQHIYDLVARFRNDVYLEDLSTTTETNVLVVDSDGKVSKTTVITGDVTGVTAGSNITVTDPTGPVPTVALSTNVDVAGTLDVTGLGTFDASITVDGKISLNDGGDSVFVGEDAGLNDDASANQNVGVGYQALRANTTGSANTANGAGALYSNTTGDANTANGAGALYSNTTGSTNTANGYAALYSNTTGYANTANGAGALYSNTTGILNTAFGAAALYSNTTGFSNTANGYQALYNNTTGYANTANGYLALYNNTTGYDNTANGGSALRSNTTGDQNIAVGSNAGTYITGGVSLNTVTSNSVFLGYNTKALADSQTNQIVIGYDAIGLGSNTAILGNSSITTTRLQGGIEINASDTTITRVSAGKIAVEGVNVVTTSSTDTLTNKTLTSPTLTTPALGTPDSGDLTNCTFPTLNQSTTGNADTVTTNANLTGHITSVGNITSLGSFTSAQLSTALGVGVTGTGRAVFQSGPILITPVLGVASATSINKLTITVPLSPATLALVGGSSLITAGAFETTLTSIATTNVTLPTTGTLATLGGTETLSNKTFSVSAGFKGSTSGATHLQATAIAGSTTLTLPAATDKLVGANTIDVLTNKTLTAPTITGAGAIAGVFTGNITGNVTGNADTVTTNADLTGPVTSTGNTTAIASGAITTDMQKHLQTFEFNGFISSAASTNYFIPTTIFENKGPFLHNVDAGASGTTALLPAVLSRSGGKVMPYAGTCKLWKGWVGVTGTAAFKVSIFKYTPVPNDATPDSLVLVKEFSGTAAGSSNSIAIDLTTGFVSLSAGDILITGISCAVGATAYFTSTLEVEWD
jgi:hypothetical protein